MKIKMTIPYRTAWVFIVVCTALLVLLAAMTTGFAIDGSYGMAILCLAIAAMVIVAMAFRFNYGIRINDKRVVAIEQAGMKILRYQDVSDITIKFTRGAIAAEIKMKTQATHLLVWDKVFLGNSLILPNENKINLNDDFVHHSIENLSKCNKVKIQNFYDI